MQAGLATALRHVAVVRYDAFGDVSGRQSFSAALLDDHGDGIVITSLHARTQSRTLLKGISGGQADGLSPEERQVVDYARERHTRERERSERLGYLGPRGTFSHEALLTLRPDATDPPRCAP